MSSAIGLVLGLVGFFALMALPLVLRDLVTTWRDTRRLRQAVEAVPSALVLGHSGILRRYLVVQVGRRQMQLRALRVGRGVTTAGMEVRQPLDSSLRELGEGLARRFRAMSEYVRIGDFGSQQLTVSWPQTQDIEDRLVWALAFRDAVDLGSPWAVCARELGLEVGEDGEIHGELDGVLVSARLTDEGACQLRAACTSPVRAAHKDLLVPSAQPTGNLVLDQLIKVGPGSPPEWFERTERVEALLEVLHGYPGSRLHLDGITLAMPGLKLDIEPELRKLVRLAKELSD